MKTIKYKTLIGLLNQTRQMTVDQFINGRFHHNTKGWINFKLDEKKRKRYCKTFPNIVLQQRKRKNKCFITL